MARLVYACRFDVPGAGSYDSIVAPAYEKWMENRYSRAHGTEVEIDLSSEGVASALPPEHTLTIERFEAERTAIRIGWAFPGDQGLIWRNSVRIADLPDCCAVEHQVYLHSKEFLVAPASFNVGAPGVIRTICEEHAIRFGEMRLRASLYPLKVNGVEDFVALLASPLRKVPVVLTTPFANGDSSDIDGHDLATRLVGVAIVAEADSPETTRELSQKLGRLGCYDGAVRTYWPGFHLDDDLRRHPLIFGPRIAMLGAQRAARSIERSIFSIAGFRFVPDPRIDGIIAACEAARRVERAAVAKGEGDTTWEAFALEVSAELDAANEELASVRAENANLRDNQKVLFAFAEEESAEPDIEGEPARNPTSVVEAVEFAQVDCGNLTFLDSSVAAARSSPFRRPAEIYEALSVMNKVANVWKRNQGGGDLRQMLIDGGLGRRVSDFISQTSKGKWKDDYTFTYDGKRQLFTAHVTLGAGSADTCASIHFLPDPERGKLVIGHVGKHLTNTRS